MFASCPRRLLPAPGLAAFLLVAVVGSATETGDVAAATISAVRDDGHRDVLINDYRTDGLGTFELTDGASRHRALCIEADVEHSARADAYRPVPSEVGSPELDALLWWVEQQSGLDDDTATAAAALAWYYAGARRNIGPPVWSDWTRGFAPISPTAPDPWGSLPVFTMTHPIGLRAGGVDLDIAERRVAELHALAVGFAPPWQLSPVGDASFIVANGAGSVAGVLVEISIERPGEEPFTTIATTDSGGRVDLDLPPLPDGATVRARVESPGAHREWDGDDIQRMATATTDVLDAHTVIPPLPRYVEVVKSSGDPTISPAGAVFALADADGRLIESRASGEDGVARFGPVMPTEHPEPYTLTEASAPIGLLRDDRSVTLAQVSLDPGHPTRVEWTNAAATVDLVVRKRLTVEAAGPRDRSGFEFVATRRADGHVVHGMTDAGGRTGPIALAIGEWEVCEATVPSWASGLTDGGCVDLTIGPDELASAAIEIDYLNIVPVPSIDTTATDAADGDREVEGSAARVLDRVSLDGLVPGTEYVLEGSIVAVGSDVAGSPDARATSTATFTATEPSARVDLTFEVSGLSPGRLVVVARLMAGDTVVADHDDLADPDQTITVAARPTTSTTVAPTPAPTTTTGPTTTAGPASSTATTTTVASSTPALPTTAGTSNVPTTSPPTLPPTGISASVGRLLDLGDLVVVAGVAMICVAARQRRPDANEAEC